MTSEASFSRRRFFGATAAVGGAVLASPAPGLLGMSAMAVPAKPSADHWQIGCYTRPWDNYPYLVAMDAIAKAGYKYLGLMTQTGKTRTVLSVTSTVDEAVKVGEEAKQRGLKILSAYLGGINMTDRDSGATELRHCVDLAVAARAASVLLVGPYNRKEFDIFCGSVADCCDYASQKHIALTIKPHGGISTNSRGLREIVAKVGHKNFSVYYDPGNIFAYTSREYTPPTGILNPVDDVSGVDGLVTGLIIKDWNTKTNSSSNTPGTGSVDFPLLMAKLKKGGFTSGPLLVETLFKGDLPQILDSAKKARRFLENLVS